MTLKMMPAYVGTIDSNRTLVLPADIPVGATVFVFVVPTHAPAPDDADRRARFAETLAAVRTAFSAPRASISDSELDALIDTARKTPQA